MKYIHLITIMLMLLLMACSSSRKSGDTPIALPTANIQADSCMTEKQYKMRLQFVLDSMKIESKNAKTEIKHDTKVQRDSIDAEKAMHKIDAKVLQDSIKANKKLYQDAIKSNRKMYQDSLDTYRKVFQDSMQAMIPITKQQEKTVRAEIKQENRTDRSIHRQEEKTKRSKWWVWLIVGFTLGILVSNIKIRPFY